MVGMGDWVTPALILAGALAGGFVNGLTGFGTALTGLPLWLQVVEPLVAAQLASACSILGHAASPRSGQRSLDWRRLAPMLTAGLIGVPIGTWLLAWISLAAFKLAVGLVLVAYCLFMLLAAGRVTLTVGGRGAEAAVGFAGGILGGIAGLSGVLPTVWAALTSWPKDQRRAMFQAFNTALLTAMLAASLVQDLVGRGLLAALGVALPGTLLGSWAGGRVYHRLDDRSFDRIVLIILLLSGLALVWSIC